MTIPVKTNETGHHISYNLTHRHSTMEEFLRFNISIFKQDHHLVLTPSKNFLAPSVIVEWRRKDRHIRRQPQQMSMDCHYQGYVHGESDSRVAISACNGLVRIFFVQLRHSRRK